MIDSRSRRLACRWADDISNGQEEFAKTEHRAAILLTATEGVWSNHQSQDAAFMAIPEQLDKLLLLRRL